MMFGRFAFASAFASAAAPAAAPGPNKVGPDPPASQNAASAATTRAAFRRSRISSIMEHLSLALRCGRRDSDSIAGRRGVGRWYGEVDPPRDLRVDILFP